MYRFHHSNVDTNLFLQLQDLTNVLSRNERLQFEFSYGSFIDLITEKITASRIWDRLQEDTKLAGLKSDLYLRTLGTLYHSSVYAMKEYAETIESSTMPKFASQLFTLLEDIRLEEIIKSSRPGTKTVFRMRHEYYKHYFESQLAANVTKGLATDELFCLIYLLLFADSPDPAFPRANDEQLASLEQMKPVIYRVFEAKSTNEITAIAYDLLRLVQHKYSDSIHEYFMFPIGHIHEASEDRLFDELTRTDDVANKDKQTIDEEKNEYIDQRFSTWHRENKNNDRKQTFLQFELEVGTKTNMLGGGARETEDGDQAMGTIQGASGESKKNDYSKLESPERKEANRGKQSEYEYGEENKHAVKVIKEAEKPSVEDMKLYMQFLQEIEPYKRKLSATLKKTLEHRKNEPRSDLLFGRLSKKLLPLVLDENPRVFYKKNEESKEFDAAFTLLVDCSASMHNKMDETKKGIILFHEVLKSLKIPHSIIGFWEDANEVKENYQPNYFHIVHSFADSLYGNHGPKIMQLDAEEDNRDGFSIRVASEELEARTEKHKFLLVFTDGEPAASDYSQNGIIDTHLAVSETRKKGMDVIGMFLADGEVQEKDEIMMKNIYGKEHILIPTVSDLPEHFAPLLKKLLLKTI